MNAHLVKVACENECQCNVADSAVNGVYIFILAVVTCSTAFSGPVQRDGHYPNRRTHRTLMPDCYLHNNRNVPHPLLYTKH